MKAVMHTIRSLNLALIMAQVLSACSSNQPAQGGSPTKPDPSAPLAMANDWTLSVAAGTPGGPGSRDGLATDARFFRIGGIAHIGTKLYLSDTGNVAIRQYDPATNRVSTLAGHLGSSAFQIVDATGQDAYFRFPGSIAALEQNLYVSDDGDSHHAAQLRCIDSSTGNVVTLTSPGTDQPWTEHGSSYLRLTASANQLYVASDTAIYAYDPIQGTFERIIGIPKESSMTDGNVDSARFGLIMAVAYDGARGLFVMDAGDLRFVDLDQREVETLAGSDHLASDAGDIRGFYGFADGTGENAQFGDVVDISFANSTAYLADTPPNPFFQETGPLAYAHNFGRLRAYNSAKAAVSTTAGYIPRPTAMVGELDGPAETARFLRPSAVYADSKNVYVGSMSSLRRVSLATGEVELVAGALISSPLYRPAVLAIDNGRLYTFSYTQLELMGIDLTTSALSTVIGFDSNKFRVNSCVSAAVGGALYCAGHYRDPETMETTYPFYSVNLSTSEVNSIASLAGKNVCAVAPDGTRLVVLTCSADNLPDHLWQFDPNEGGTSSDWGPVKGLSSYYARLVVSDGFVYITDGARLARFNMATRKLDTLAGDTSAPGCSDGTAEQVHFTQLLGIAQGPGGLFIADGICHTVSFLSLDTGKVTRLAGNPDDPDNVIFKVGQGPDAGFNWPIALAYDASSQSLYVADSMDNVIGRLTPAKH